MKGLINDAAEIQKYVRVAGTFKAASFLPFVLDWRKKNILLLTWVMILLIRWIIIIIQIHQPPMMT